MTYTILAVNPGSTSTKTAIYQDTILLFEEEMKHNADELTQWGSLENQASYRKSLILRSMKNHGVFPGELDAVVGRGGMLPPVKSGGYIVNEAMLRLLRSHRVTPHASNLGAVIACDIAQPLGIPAYIYDAVSSDEMCDVARVTGLPEISRQSFCHVLNSKATARKAAEQMGSTYEAMNFIVAHIGGGISISAHQRGRIIDVITDDAGPFSPERAGSVPLGYIIDMCFNSGMNQSELTKKLKQNSGLKGHLGTNDGLEIERRIAAGDEKARRVYEALAYQIAKGIGEMAPPLFGKVDAVILTGGLARSEYITQSLIQRVAYLAPVKIFPGGQEMEALATGALRILRGEEGVSRIEDAVKDLLT